MRRSSWSIVLLVILLTSFMTPCFAAGKNSGYDRLYRAISFEGIDFLIPKYYDDCSYSDEGGYHELYPEPKNAFASLMFGTYDVPYSLSEERFQQVSQTTFEYTASQGGYTMSPMRKITVAGYDAYTVSGEKTDPKTKEIHYSLQTVIYKPEEDIFVSVLLDYDSDDKTRNNYSGDYATMLEKAVARIPCDLAVVSRGKYSDIYILFDTQKGNVRYVSTDQTYISVYRFSGNEQNGFQIKFVDGDEKWTNRLYRNPNKKNSWILKDSYGFEYEFEQVDAEKAWNALQKGHHYELIHFE